MKDVRAFFIRHKVALCQMTRIFLTFGERGVKSQSQIIVSYISAESLLESKSPQGPLASLPSITFIIYLLLLRIKKEKYLKLSSRFSTHEKKKKQNLSNNKFIQINSNY